VSILRVAGVNCESVQPVSMNAPGERM